MNKPYMYQQRNHLSRYDSYNENNMNQKYSYNQANASCNNNTYQNTEYNNFNSFNNTNNNNQSSNFSKSCNNLNNKNQDIKQVQSVVQPQVQNTNQVSRSRTNSESASMSPVNKKFKKSEDVEKSKAVDDESWDENMEDKAINETVEEKKIEETEVKLEENNPKEKQEAPEQVIKEETKENQTEQKPGPQEPVLTSTVEDINKYYRAELVTRLTSCLGVVENLNWINQPYQKHCQYSRLCVDIKNLRSIVRVKEIKKTQQEQRLLFLQSQMKEIEEMLS